ncbi:MULTISPECIES: ABC transporter permease [Burkholderia cepacia complex]|uniref:ABC transporter permease n=1 Tax=Burkholderia cepacia complex TaxID=87882 RepID=UPI000756DF05|nr:MULTISPECIES: ABC transporter permease [Burkholderia cepacia complex]KVX60748.1 peptide ABC transporter permease [Burkholderia stagnalis]KWC06274.1 peptide ABC transporter permease [Burkholderia ubonensis]RQQ45041.1 ABC transporter permease [Burkholderia stagnalis]RQX94009.1 ABC transporter permease [Burkholderia stagnalis]RQY20346.1 ABC transporter permease [Burkholderia stagnalis]
MRIALTPRGERPFLRAMTLAGPAYGWLLLAVFLPLSVMLMLSFMTDVPVAGRSWSLTLANYATAVTDPLYRTMLARSLWLSAQVTAICTALAFPCAYMLAKVIRGRAREALFLLIILPFWSNGLVRIFSWSMVLRSGGILDLLVNHVSPWNVSVDLMFSYPAVVIGLVQSYLPYSVLTTYLSLQAIDDSLIEAARSMGASRATILRRLILPLSAPGLLAGAALIFVPVVGAFMEPRLLGGRKGTFFGTVVEDQFVAVFNWPLGAALAFMLLAVVLVILFAGVRLSRRGESQ